MPQTADFLLERLREWGVHRVFGYPGDGINGILGAFGRAGGDPEFIQPRHEEMAAFMACAHAKFTGEAGCCMATSGPGAVHLLNGPYDAKLDLASDRPVVLEFKTDPEIPPLPPHIEKDLGKKSAKAELHDPQKAGLAVHGFRQKMVEYYEKLPGRDGR